MMLNSNKKIEIENSLITILAVFLLAIYFIMDFLNDKRLLIGAIYAVLLGLSIYLCDKKTSFYESVYSLTALLISGEIFKNCVLYFESFTWIFGTLGKQFEFSAKSYMKVVLSTPHIYFYLIGVLILLIYRFAPNLCQSNVLKNVFSILGRYSIWAIVIHMCAACFTKYELIENVIFCVFLMSAFWTAYTKEKFETQDVAKAILLVVEISVFILLYPNQYISFVENFLRAQGITWIYLVGLFLMCVLCILSEKIMQDIIIGFVILGTILLFVYGKLNHVAPEPANIVLFHISALSFFYIVKNVFGFDKDYKKRRYLKALLASCYMMAFLLTVFIANDFTKSTIILCIGLVFLFVYAGNFVRVKGTIYGTVIYGALPWILLETTMQYLGKINASLFSVILFTILFWCTCSVALSWKDTANIKTIAFEKANSKMIINGLSGIAYFLTILVLF
mgnify:CR=1 FL=1